MSVIGVGGGNHDMEGIVRALITAKTSKNKTSFIIFGQLSELVVSQRAMPKLMWLRLVRGCCKHEEVIRHRWIKHLQVSDEVYGYFRSRSREGGNLSLNGIAWPSLTRKEHPEFHCEFALRVAGKFPDGWSKFILTKGDSSTTPTISRKSRAWFAILLLRMLGVIDQKDIIVSCSE